MIFYVGNPMKSIKKLLKLISEFTNIAGYKINIQNQLYFYVLVTNTLKLIYRLIKKDSISVSSDLK